ncbi:hypothetical protein SSTU70S_00160 [Stutzerimonas stutzeri]
MTDKGERCRQHYQSVYERNQPEISKGRALDESLHHFLDQRPAGKNLSAIDRAQGLATASFWLDVDAVAGADLASLALSRVLHFDNAASVELLWHLATHNPETLRWAIRYAKLFERTDRRCGLRCVRRSPGMSGKFSSVSVIACLISSGLLMS